MNVEFKAADIAKIRSDLANIKNGYQKVIVTSINKTANTAKVQSKARIGNELNLPAKRIDKDLTVNKANYSNMSGSLVSKGNPVGLISFSSIQKEAGISVKVLKTGARKLIKHTFIEKGNDNTGTLHMYMREYTWGFGAPGKIYSRGKRHPRAGWSRMPVKYSYKLRRLTGPRIEDFFAKDQIINPVTIQANKLLGDTANKQMLEVIRRSNL